MIAKVNVLLLALCAAALSVSGRVFAQSSAGLMVHLPFDANFSGGVITDTSGHAAHGHRFGRPGNTTSNWPSAIVGPDGSQAAEFGWSYDGWGRYGRSGDYAGITNTAALVFQDRATIMCWGRYYRATNGNISLDHNAILVSAGYVKRGCWQLGRSFSAATSFMVTLIDGGQATEEVMFPDSTLTTEGDTGGWRHYAVTFDRGAVAAYFNGQLCASYTMGVTNLTVAQAAWVNPWVGVGCNTHVGTPAMEDEGNNNDPNDDYPNNGWLNGTMDDLRIYSRVLTPAEIFTVYTNADHVAPTVPADVVAGWASNQVLEVRWTDSTDNLGALRYDVLRNGSVVVANLTSNRYFDVSATPGVAYTYTVEAIDDAGHRSGQSASALGMVPVASAPLAVIVDDAAGTPAVTLTGSWAVSTASPGYWGTGYRHDGNADKGTKTANLRPTLPQAGSYSVYVWYTANANRASNMPVTIFYNGGSRALQVSERQDGSQWRLLGTYSFAAGTNGLVRIQTGGTDGFVLVDAVRFVRVDTPAADTELPTIPTQVGAQVVSTRDVRVSWSSSTDNVGVVAYEVWRDGNVVATTSATNYTDTALLPATTYTYAIEALDAAGNRSGLSASASATLPAGAVDLVVDNAAGPTLTQTVGAWTQANSSAGFWPTNYLHDGNAGKGTKRVTFRPTLVAGVYDVFVWYVASANRATNVPLDIVSASGTRTVLINQRVNGSTWVALGSDTFAAGTNGCVTLRTDGTVSGFVIADAVRFKMVTTSVTTTTTTSSTTTTADPGADIVVDNADGPNRVQLVGAWTAVTTSPGYWAANYLHDGNTAKGTKSTSFRPDVVEAGSYEVAIWYVAAANRATNVPVEIVHAGGTNAFLVNQRVNGSRWVVLGTNSFATGTNGYVRIGTTGTSSGFVTADAIRLRKAIPPVPGVDVVVDDAQAQPRFAMTGPWTLSSSSPGYYGSGYRHDGNTGKGSKRARFSPDLPEAGTYAIYAWYPAFNNRASNVPVDIVDTLGTQTVVLNQRVGGSQWTLLGAGVFGAGTNGYVEMRTDGTDGYVLADAIRFFKTGEGPAAPVASGVRVTEGGIAGSTYHSATMQNAGPRPALVGVWHDWIPVEDPDTANLVDKNSNTLWRAAERHATWQVVLDFGQLLTVDAFGARFENAPWSSISFVGSSDGYVWVDLSGVSNSPVALRYAFVSLWQPSPLETNTPAVREIIWHEAPGKMR